LELKSIPNKFIPAFFARLKSKTLYFTSLKSNPAKKGSDFINAANFHSGIKRYYNVRSRVYRVGFLKKISP
jgi:hypothetical protein